MNTHRAVAWAMCRSYDATPYTYAVHGHFVYRCLPGGTWRRSPYKSDAEADRTAWAETRNLETDGWVLAVGPRVFSTTGWVVPAMVGGLAEKALRLGAVPLQGLSAGVGPPMDPRIGDIWIDTSEVAP